MSTLTSPAPAQLAELRTNQKLCLFDEPHEIEILNGSRLFQFELPLPELSLIQLSHRPSEEPDKVKNMRATIYEGLENRNEILITWDGPFPRFVRTHNICLQRSTRGSF
jgi:hypothetical protein